MSQGPGGYDWQSAQAQGAPQAVAGVRLAFLRKVYGLFTASIVLSALGAMLALYAGLGASSVSFEAAGRTIVMPPLVAFFAQHWVVGLVIMFGSVMGASAVRHRPGINVLALFGMATILGVVFAPSLFFATT